MNKKTTTILEPEKFRATKKLFVGVRGHVVAAVKANPTKISYQTALAQVQRFHALSAPQSK